MKCMKFQKNITFDGDIIAKIANEQNLSALINKLLKQHYENEGAKKNG